VTACDHSIKADEATKLAHEKSVQRTKVGMAAAK
jgi:hypothetical protein